MSGILNSRGAVSGILGTTEGTTAASAATYTKTGSQTWDGDGSQYINGCFSTDYAAYLINGHFWSPASSGYGIYAQLADGTDSALTGSNYNYAYTGWNYGNTSNDAGQTGLGHWVLESGLSGSTSAAFSMLLVGTHESSAYAGMTGMIQGDTMTWAFSGIYTTQATTITGFYLYRESNNGTDGWMNVYGITGDYS